MTRKDLTIVALATLAVLIGLGTMTLFMDPTQIRAVGALTSFVFNLTQAVVCVAVITVGLRKLDDYMSDEWKAMIAGWKQYAAIYYGLRFFGVCDLVGRIIGF
jgi:uncharacterized membrane protein YhaH (DUF805 family)